jgi:hypothetical protein
MLAGWGSTTAATPSAVALGVTAPFPQFALNEVLRLPPSFMIARTIAEPHRALPFVVGDLVLVSPWLIHHNTLGWSDPERYDPARWRGSAGPHCFHPSASARAAAQPPLSRVPRSLPQSSCPPIPARPGPQRADCPWSSHAALRWCRSGFDINHGGRAAQIRITAGHTSWMRFSAPTTLRPAELALPLPVVLHRFTLGGLHTRSVPSPQARRFLAIGFSPWARRRTACREPPVPCQLLGRTERSVTRRSSRRAPLPSCTAMTSICGVVCRGRTRLVKGWSSGWW